MSNSVQQLKALQAAFQKNDNNNQTRQNNYYPFWNMKIGEQAVIRFLPDKNSANPLGFMVEKLTHSLVINGEKKTVPCRKMYNEECAICKVSSAYYKDNDKVNGKKFWRKAQHSAQVLVVEDPLPADETTKENHQGKVRYVTLSFQLFNVIKEALLSGDLEDMPFSYTDGYNFVIKKSQQGEYDTYTVGSRFKNKPSSLTEEEIALADGHIVDLSTLLPQDFGSEKVEAMLQAALTGSEYAEGSSSEESSAEEAKPTVVKATESVSVSATADAAAEDTDEEANKIIEQIRLRRQGKA